jgi:hypothetical protein
MGCKYVKDFEFGSDKGFSGSSGKTQVKTYMRGGSACGEMKKGGKASKSAPKKTAKKTQRKARSEKARSEDAMIENLLTQVISQAAQTGRVPGVPSQVTQGAPMPAPNARAVPVAPQSPLIAMMHGGKARK